jgi:hypothetical protein
MCPGLPPAVGDSSTELRVTVPARLEDEKLDYLHNNSVESGLVNEAERYRYSSAIDYADGVGLVTIEKLLVRKSETSLEVCSVFAEHYKQRGAMLSLPGGRIVEAWSAGKYMMPPTTLRRGSE